MLAILYGGEHCHNQDDYEHCGAETAEVGEV
jgi:hypothetical protein